jgi:ABC-type sugar transport system ATPase subunit
LELDLPGARVALPARLTQARPGLRAYIDREIIVGARPETATLADDGKSLLRGVVLFQEDLGANLLTTVRLAADAPAGPILIEELGESDIPKVSDRLRLNSQGGARRAIDERVGIALDLDRLLFFDPTSKLTIV